MKRQTLILALFAWGCGPSVSLDEPEGSSTDASSGEEPSPGSTGGDVPPTPPGTTTTSSPPVATTTGAVGSSESGSSTGVMRDPASVLWEEHTGGRILSLAVTDDSSVWALVDGPQLHVERFASTGELHANQPLAAPELPEGAVEARRDGGDIVYLDGAPIYGFSWTFLDGSGAELDRVARIERVDNAASAWIHEWPGADVRLGTAGEDLVGTDDVARFKFRSDGVEIWRVEDDEPGSFLDVEGLDNGSLMAMSRGLLIRYRADGVPAWFVNFESEPTDDFNTGIVALEDSALGILRSFRDDEDQILGGLIVFDQSGNIAHSQELPMPTSTFDLDEDGNVYAETPSSALAKFDPSEAVEWVADLEPAGGDGIVEVGPSGALYYAQGDSIIRLEP